MSQKADDMLYPLHYAGGEEMAVDKKRQSIGSRSSGCFAAGGAELSFRYRQHGAKLAQPFSL